MQRPMCLCVFLLTFVWVRKIFFRNQIGSVSNPMTKCNLMCVCSGALPDDPHLRTDIDIQTETWYFISRTGIFGLEIGPRNCHWEIPPFFRGENPSLTSPNLGIDFIVHKAQSTRDNSVVWLPYNNTHLQ